MMQVANCLITAHAIRRAVPAFTHAPIPGSRLSARRDPGLLGALQFPHVPHPINPPPDDAVSIAATFQSYLPKGPKPCNQHPEKVVLTPIIAPIAVGETLHMQQISFLQGNQYCSLISDAADSYSFASTIVVYGVHCARFELHRHRWL